MSEPEKPKFRFKTNPAATTDPAPPAKEMPGLARVARDGGGGQVMPDMDDKADAVLAEAFAATTGQWDAKAQVHVERPDIKTRLDALKLYLAYRHGMPLQRQLRIETSFKDHKTEMLELANTPSGRKVLLAAGLIDDDWLKMNLPDSQK